MQQMYDTYYTSRHSVRELCCDYPADEPLVEGLYAMQMHLVNRGAVLTIPVLNVMNTAHYIAACMMQTGAEGDQYEYDTLAYMRLGHDAQVAMLAIMVLTTMLKRTDGQRARQCRNVLMEDRNEDFYEGLSLYERFISSSERRFEEQDFLTDTMRQISDLQNTVQQLTLEKKELQKQLETMNQIIRIEQPTVGQNFGSVTINNYYPQPVAETNHEDRVCNSPSTIMPDFFCVSERFTEQNIRERLDAELSMATSKIEYCRSLYRLQHIGCINLNQYSSDAQRAIVFNRYQTKFILTASDFCKARLNK